jgi:twinfilin-like protein
VEAASHPSSGSLATDWGSLIGKAGNTAAYILVKIGSDSEWLTITYVPDDTRVKDKMIYAATKATLLNHLGYQHFYDELHATNSSELSYEYYQGSKKPVNATSQKEDIIEFAKNEENKEREFREQNANVRGSGGYHSVSLPFSPSAETMVRQIASGSVNFVELAINQAKNGIDGRKATDAGTVSQLQNLVNEHEPRFYLYKYNNSLLFLYCCPDRSPQQLRMVYSTSKSSISQQVVSCGANVSKTGEISDRSELTDQYLRELTQARAPSSPMGPSRASPARPSWVKNDNNNDNKAARPTSMVDNAHPVYSLMTSNPSRAGKKIVIPPPGAY